MIKVRKHKGRSGKSVYEWRVYRVREVNPGRTITTQLGKYRTEEQAQGVAEYHRNRDKSLERTPPL